MRVVYRLLDFLIAGFIAKRSKARSNSSRFSDASTFFAVSTKRLWRSASVSLGFFGLETFMSTCPRLTEFMLLGYPLGMALSIRARWDSLSAREREELGFTSFQQLEQAPQATDQSG